MAEAGDGVPEAGDGVPGPDRSERALRGIVVGSVAVGCVTIAWMLVGVAGLSLCGVGGCSGAGYGAERDVSGGVAYLGLAVLVGAFPAALVPWHRRTSVRLCAAVACSVLVVGGTALLRSA
ncbi:hypothetical protein E8D34_03345 [Nocardioides sp. GY 10113]|uniref:hypothetical protein n=1 Tax=Nocardioides sp. GY 10113 TaxID=2569761 RepID=UPI0010A8A4E7|nr:hypothetical protein [Nocardioides sp. GY 10113]TIC88716.1 hypothetical protein E8D34_03345 [Nocardioides sp. GY 10113]